MKAQGIEFEEIPIRETPPTKVELKQMLGYLDGDLRKLFNTSGGDYRSMNLKETLPTLSEEEAFELLSGNGNLVKRPFLLAKDKGAVGFKEDVWAELALS